MRKHFVRGSGVPAIDLLGDSMNRVRRILLLATVVVSAVLALALRAVAAGPAASLPNFLVTPTALSFGQVLTGSTSPAQATTITNISSGTMVVTLVGGTVSAPFSSTQDCQGTSLAPGASCHISYTFAPTSADGATATSSFTVNGQSASVKLKGAGVAATFEVSPSKLSFNPTVVGTTSAQQAVTVTNVSPGSVTMSVVGGDVSAPYGKTQDCQGASLAPGQTCHFSYTFAPTTTGPATATSSFTLNGQSASVDLAGIGVKPTLLITPTTIAFGPVKTGTSAPQQVVTITNLSYQSLVISTGGGSVAAPFSLSQDCQGVSLAYGQSCHYTYGFHPTAIGKFATSSSGTINGIPFRIKMSGQGI
jgi:hypothetical protein